MFNSYQKTFYEALRLCINQAIKEDLGVEGDHTSKAIFPAEHQSTATLIAKDTGVLAGVRFCKLVLDLHAPNIKLTPIIEDGGHFNNGDTLFTLSGNTQNILSLERILLNAVQRMSGIATITNSVQNLIQHTSCRVLDTRKTTPNFRVAEKWAVHIGGGVNHRMGLYDAIMLKDNHIDFCGGLSSALDKINTYVQGLSNSVPIIVETRNIEEVKVCLKYPWLNRILLDNMTPDRLHEAISVIAGAFPTEASGNISPKNIVSYAETGVDFVSLGYITHSAPIVDVSLRAI